MSVFARLPEPYLSFAAAHPTRVPVALTRFFRMRRRGLLSCRPRRTIARDRRVVISLTTLPSRIGHLRQVLNSLIDQDAPADEIVLALPRVSRREKVPYTIPGFLRASDAVSVLACDRDWGPATKLIPALLAERRPDTLILALDDDNVYPRNMVSNFLAWHERYPEHALCYRGWTVPDSLDYNEKRVRFATTIDGPMSVDVATGTWGFMVQPRHFDKSVTNYTGYPAEAFFVDDIWFNGHMARRGVERMLIPAADPPLSTLASVVNALGVVENATGAKDNAALRAFEPYWACRTRTPVRRLAA